MGPVWFYSVVLTRWYAMRRLVKFHFRNQSKPMVFRADRL